MMDSPTPTLRLRSAKAISRLLKIGINPSIGPVECTTTREIGKRPRTIFQSARDKELVDARELYGQEQLVDHDRRSEQSVGKYLGWCETVTSILIRIQVMSKEEGLCIWEVFLWYSW